MSTVNGRVAGVGSVIPERVARTENVYRPSVSGPYAFGDAQLVYVPVVVPGPSSLHSNVEPDSVAVNRYDGEVTFVGPDGPPVSCVSGVFGPGGLGSGGSPWKRASAKSPPAVGPDDHQLAVGLHDAVHTDRVAAGERGVDGLLAVVGERGVERAVGVEAGEPECAADCPKVTILPLPPAPRRSPTSSA